MPSTTAQNSRPKHPSPTLPCAARKGGGRVCRCAAKSPSCFCPSPLAQPRGRLGGGRFACVRSTTTQNSRQKHPSPTLPCAARKGGGYGCRCAAKSPSCFCPSPLAQPRGRLGGGALRAHALHYRAELPPKAPLPNPPLRCAQGRGLRLPLRCEKPELLLPLPFGARQGRRLGGGRFARMRSTTAQNSRQKHPPQPSPALRAREGAAFATVLRKARAAFAPPRPSPALRAREGVTSAQGRRQGRCAS